MFARTGLGAATRLSLAGWTGSTTVTSANADMSPGEEAVRFAVPGAAPEVNGATA